MILITGGTGFVGSRLAHALAHDEVPHAVLTRGRSSRARLPGNTRIVIGDMMDPAGVSSALEGVDTVVHLAANLTDADDPAGGFARNVQGTRTIANAARAAGAARVLHISSAAVYRPGATSEPLLEDAPTGDTSPYGQSKLDAEHALYDALAGSQTRWVVLRPPGLYGPGRPQTLAFMREIQQKTMWFHGVTRKTVHPTHVDDLVAACVAVLHRRDVVDDVFNVGGERPVLYQELIALVAELLPHKVFQLSLPALGRAVNRAVCSDKAVRRLGLSPRPLREGMASCIATFRAERLLQ